MTIDWFFELRNKFLSFQILGLCAEAAGIKPTNFHLFYDLPHENMCQIIGMITRHEIIPSKIKATYDAIMNSNFNCPPPTKYAKIVSIKKCL